MYVYANCTTTYAGPEGRVHLELDDVWDATDPFVLAHHNLFSDAPTNVKRTVPPRPAVEQATAAPGERRGGRGRS